MLKSDFQTMKNFLLEKVFTLIEPAPVLIVSTAVGKRKNVMTISWSTPIAFEPLFAIVTGPWNYSFDAMMNTGECVVAIPDISLIGKTVGIGTCSGSECDKFKKFGLTAKRAKMVGAPLIEDCAYNIECKVRDYIKRRDIVILEAVKAWESPDAKKRKLFSAVGDGTFVAEGRRWDFREEMQSKLPPCFQGFGLK